MDANKEDAMNRDPNATAALCAEDLTHDMLVSYLARGRYLQSVFVANLISGLWRMIKVGCLRGVKIIRAIYVKLGGKPGSRWEVLLLFLEAEIDKEFFAGMNKPENRLAPIRDACNHMPHYKWFRKHFYTRET